MMKKYVSVFILVFVLLFCGCVSFAAPAGYEISTEPIRYEIILSNAPADYSVDERYGAPIVYPDFRMYYKDFTEKLPDGQKLEPEELTDMDNKIPVTNPPYNIYAYTTADGKMMHRAYGAKYEVLVLKDGDGIDREFIARSPAPDSEGMYAVDVNITEDVVAFTLVGNEPTAIEEEDF